MPHAGGKAAPTAASTAPPRCPAWRHVAPGSLGPSRQGRRCSASGGWAVGASGDREVTLLDYGAGNVRSVRNAIRRLGFEVKDVQNAQDIVNAQRLIFPGVGSFGHAMDVIRERGYVEPLREYIEANRPFYGVCLGLQLLFEGSDENGGCEGMGLIPGCIQKFDTAMGLPVPQIGWNNLDQRRPSRLLQDVGDRRVYFVHSYRAVEQPGSEEWVLATTNYGEDFISVVGRGEVYASQFHPEKSGTTGLGILKAFLQPEGDVYEASTAPMNGHMRGLAKRVIACLDVRANDSGDLVVTKGDQYDVREKDETAGRPVRNLGKPVDLATRYFQEGADEVTFLNITGFRDFPLADLPMLDVVQRTSEGVFVPLTIGGGIRGFKDATGKEYTALEVASAYFRSGADKVSIGSDAVYIVEDYLKTGIMPEDSSIQQISEVYGAQAVVVSIDPKRVYVADPGQCPHKCFPTALPGLSGEQYCWWQCTVKGGRETRDVGAVELAKAVEDLGAGEILLNCIDRDGTGEGFDLELVEAVSSAVTIPVIASSGAGVPQHFTEVFAKTKAAAALAAGIFHRKEVEIQSVKEDMAGSGIPTRL
ncbi:unnamed protein product [Ostreobium quekettii]|uniref:Imidazole glycerol phosphate synthase hisHF n=1 Tax=Ostreobium quekettii TaxID=121088 RepID=A0A8S1J7P2_9CHLO|nr:unnamed protein product [Ostreobium quekettii]|eukprot:evm.model.scf_3123.1 EVM.evm.TU.scf_3123.1   scf_3123:3547-9653(+)